MKQKRRCKKKINLQMIVSLNQDLMNLNKWNIKVRWATKQDFKAFRLCKKLEPTYVGKAESFLGILVDSCHHKKKATIALNKKYLKTEHSVFETLIHEMFHIQMNSFGEAIFLTKGKRDIRGQFVSQNKEEKLIEKLLDIVNNFYNMGRSSVLLEV